MKQAAGPPIAFETQPNRGLGLGGYHLGKIDTDREAIRIVHAAIDAGITFIDNAWEYHDGRSVNAISRGAASWKRLRM